MTTDLPFLFALSAVMAAMLASIAVWAPRPLLVKLGALGCAGLFLPLGYLGLSDLMSRPKPVALEWWMGHADEATVLGSQMREGDGLYLWLQVAGVPEPRAYRLPWDQKMAEQLQKALAEAEHNGGGVQMRLPFEPTLDAREPKFYAMPQPALPPKDLTQPPAQVYKQPGQDA
ncbi:MAG: hypothetical protein U1E17_22795 [Geminicoccaceae bacterium]